MINKDIPSRTSYASTISPEDCSILKDDEATKTKESMLGLHLLSYVGVPLN